MIQKDLFHVYGAARIVKSTVFTNKGGEKKNALKPLEYEGGSMCVCVHTEPKPSITTIQPFYF